MQNNIGCHSLNSSPYARRNVGVQFRIRALSDAAARILPEEMSYMEFQRPADAFLHTDSYQQYLQQSIGNSPRQSRSISSSVNSSNSSKTPRAMRAASKIAIAHQVQSHQQQQKSSTMSSRMSLVHIPTAASSKFASRNSVIIRTIISSQQDLPSKTLTARAQLLRLIKQYRRDEMRARPHNIDDEQHHHLVFELPSCGLSPQVSMGYLGVQTPMDSLHDFSKDQLSTEH
ncbi:hypothetical protein MIR68_008126 [Amoeboaphelidium protococcarum]|nr:hypothetical protein MIR68_008126 [Amoeboaphelidium protococcarum]